MAIHINLSLDNTLRQCRNFRTRKDCNLRKIHKFIRLKGSIASKGPTTTYSQPCHEISVQLQQLPCKDEHTVRYIQTIDFKLMD